MSNISYYRFESTLADLRDCFEAVQNYNDKTELIAALTKNEARCAVKIIELCREFADYFAEECDL